MTGRAIYLDRCKSCHGEGGKGDGPLAKGLSGPPVGDLTDDVWKHGDTLLRPKHGTLGWIALPNIFIFQLVLPLISPVIDLMFFGSLLLWGLAQIRITRLPQLWTTADVEKSLFFFVGFVLIDILTCMVAFALERKEDWTLLFPVLLQRFYYRQLMYVVLFRSVKEALDRRRVSVLFHQRVERLHQMP